MSKSTYNRGFALAIGAGEEAIFAIKLAKIYGFKVIAFDDNPFAKGFKYADLSYVTDITNPNNIIQLLGEKYTPKVVLPIPVGRILITAAVINDYYKLTGPSLKVADICTDKFLFHNKLASAKLRNVKCTCIKKHTVLTPQNLDYPCILKPRFGSGSKNVFALFNQEDFPKNIKLNIPFEEDMLVETLVCGKEYGVDGAVINGEYCHILLREKINTQYPYRQCVGYFSIFQKDLLYETQNYMQRVIGSLNLKNCLLHADLIYKNNAFFIIELSPRPSGHNLSSHFTILATGVNMVGEYLHFVNGERCNFNVKFSKNLLMRFFDFENCKIKQIPNFEKMKHDLKIIDYHCAIKNKKLPIVRDGNSIVHRGYVLLQGDCKAELEKNSNFIMSHFKYDKMMN